MRKTGNLAKFACYLKILMQGVWINRFQLFLTTLTMSFGSLGLALTIFLGDGALKVLWADLEDLLGDWVVVYSAPSPDIDFMQNRHGPQFQEADLQHVRKGVTGARMISPAIFDQPQRVEYRGKKVEMFGDGITEQLAGEKIFKPIQGRGLSPNAFAGNAWECMVTQDVAEKFKFDLSRNPSILLGKHLFSVVGITVNPPRNEYFRKRIIIPYTLGRILWMVPGDIGQIVVAWQKADDMESIIKQTSQILENTRGGKSFFFNSSQFQIRSSRKIVNNFIIVGATQSLFCIVIASIGVLNVMLTNVTRRTREFAIRIAMGARKKEILLIVLTESIFIGIFGAMIGILIALGIAPIIGDLMAAGIEEATQLTPDISFKGIVLPLLICGVSSLTAGIVPALKVRKMDILRALREEA